MSIGHSTCCSGSMDFVHFFELRTCLQDELVQMFNGLSNRIWQNLSSWCRMHDFLRYLPGWIRRSIQRIHASAWPTNRFPSHVDLPSLCRGFGETSISASIPTQLCVCRLDPVIRWKTRSPSEPTDSRYDLPVCLQKYGTMVLRCKFLLLTCANCSGLSLASQACANEKRPCWY